MIPKILLNPQILEQYRQYCDDYDRLERLFTKMFS